ncbi:MAG: AsmA family protein [Humidesulfovibrio sp.]
MRYLVIIGGIVVGLFVIAAVLLAVMVDPNKYKGDITRLVKDKTGRELVFEGDVKLSFFPRLGVQTGGVRLSNPPGFGDKPFSRIQAASVSIKILPLLARRVEVGRVSLEGLELQLVRDEQGLASWADFLGPDEPQKEAEPGPSGLTDLTLDGLVVKDALIVWENRQTAKRYVVTGLNVDVQAIRPGKPFDFEAKCSLESTAPELKAKAEISGTATLNLPDQRHLLTKLLAKVSAVGAGVPGGKGEFSLGLAEFKLDTAQQTAQGTGLTFGAYGAKGTGQFLASNLSAGPDTKGRIEIADFNGRELSAALTGKAPDTADAGAYQHISAAVEFKTGKGYTDIPTFTASLDEARVEGRLRITGIEKKSVNFNVRIDGLDADRFLPAKKDEQAKDAARDAVTGKPKKDELFPVETLRALSLDGQLSAERFKVKGLRFASLKVPMSAQNGVLEVGQVDARLYDGSLKSTLRVDVQGAEPVVTLHLAADGIQARPLFTDLNGKPSGLAGTLFLDTSSPLVCQGNSVPALKRSLLGRAGFAIKDGVFPGVNVIASVNEAAQKAKRAATGVEAGTEKSTKFGSITGTAVITGGVVAINDLEVKAPFLRAEGRGTVNLNNKEVDYTVHARVVPSTEGQGGSSGLIGLAVPIRVTGPYDNPSYGTDYLRALGKGAIDAVGGVVTGVGNVITGKKGKDGKSSGGLLEGVKKLF